jgi:hypothetical protein
VPTLYASFSTLLSAEQGVTDLLTRGVTGQHIHLIAGRGLALKADADLAQDHAGSGVTTATPAEATHDATSGRQAILHGIEAAVSVIVRGFGMIVGESAAGITLADRIDHPGHPNVSEAYFESQGVPASTAYTYQQTLGSGGVVLAIDLDTSVLDQRAVSAVLDAYQGQQYVWDGAPLIGELSDTDAAMPNVVAPPVEHLHSDPAAAMIGHPPRPVM